MGAFLRLEPRRPEKPGAASTPTLVGKQGGAREEMPPLHPIGMSCLLPVPAPGVGSENGWGRQLCPDGYPQAVWSHSPWDSPWLGGTVENPAHWCQEVPGSLSGRLAVPTDMRGPRWVARHSPPRHPFAQAVDSIFFGGLYLTNSRLPPREAGDYPMLSSLAGKTTWFGLRATQDQKLASR